MGVKMKAIFVVLVLIEVVLLFLLFFSGSSFPLLQPQGVIAREQRNLMFFAIGIMLVVAIPLLSTLYWFAFKYRASNNKNSYRPEVKPGRLFVAMWWGIPTLVIVILAIVTWNKTHALDPYKPLESDVAPVKIQVVALQWKWLFLYPEYGIATVNFIQFPEKTPINFELTADAPMNSFWIPSLSGQIYAMTGMSTKIHIMADTVGDYRGQAAEINGRGFSGMKFVARASTNEEFERWVREVRSSSYSLDWDSYTTLSSPSENAPVAYFGSYENDLYNRIMMKFMMPSDSEKPSGPHGREH